MAPEWVTKATNSLKEAVGVEVEQQEQGLLEEWSDALNEATTLSYKQRLVGFGTCVGLGLFCTILSSLFFFHPGKFGVTYTLGNLLSLGSTGFLVGPMKQLKNMFAKHRAVASLVYFLAMFMTLFCALYLRVGILVLLFVIIQMAALTWYCLSYIPYARDVVGRCVASCFGE